MTSTALRQIRRYHRFTVALALAGLLGGCGYAQSFCGSNPVSCETQTSFN